ncbi:unnamed protein product [Chrysoparadoxa australica]
MAKTCSRDAAFVGSGTSGHQDSPGSTRIAVGAADETLGRPRSDRSLRSNFAGKVERVRCPHCSRQFAKAGAAEHIGICEKVVSRPKGLALSSSS